MMRTLRPSVNKKVTPKRAISSANGVVRRVLTPVSVQRSTNKKTKVKSNVGTRDCQVSTYACSTTNNTTPNNNLKSVQRLLQYTPPPQIIPATPAALSNKASIPRKLRVRRLKSNTNAKRRHQTRILIGAWSLVFLYCYKSGGNIPTSDDTNSTAPSIRNGPDIVAKTPSILANSSPSTTYEQFVLSSTSNKQESSSTAIKESRKRKARIVEGAAISTKRRRMNRIGFGNNWKKVITEASERLQNVPPYYPSVLAYLRQTTTTSKTRNANQNRFGDWQTAIAEASERLQTVPPYPTFLPQDGSKKKKKKQRLLAFKLPVAAIRESVTNHLTEKLPTVAITTDVRDHVKNLIVASKVPLAAAAMSKSVKNLKDRLPPDGVAKVMRDHVQTNLTKTKRTVRRTIQNLINNNNDRFIRIIGVVGEIVKKWTELVPLFPASFSHPILHHHQRKKNQHQEMTLLQQQSSDLKNNQEEQGNLVLLQ